MLLFQSLIPTIKIEKVAINLKVAKQVDAFRRQRDGLPGRPEAIRRPMDIGLKARE